MSVFLRAGIALSIVSSPAWAAEREYSAVVGVGATRVGLSSSGRGDLTELENGSSLGGGAVVFWNSGWTDVHYRFGTLIERRKFYGDTLSVRRRFDQIAVSLPFGVSYQFDDFLRPFAGVAVDVVALDRCRVIDDGGTGTAGAGCPKANLSPVVVPFQLGISLGSMDGFRVEIVASRTMVGVREPLARYDNFLILFHF
jgi:hypothetical protein